MFGDVLDEPVLILAHAEEIVALDDGVDLALAVRAELAVDQVLLREEALAGDAVVALVLGLVDEVAVVEVLHDGLDDFPVAFLGRADEVVVRDAEALPELLEPDHGAVALLDRRHAVFLGGLLDFLAVFVGAGQEPDVVARGAMVAREDVGEDGRVCVPDVGLVVDVVDRGRYVKCAVAHVRVPFQFVRGSGPVRRGHAAPGHRRPVRTGSSRSRGRRACGIRPCRSRASSGK